MGAGALSLRFDLEGEARRFADELSSLLNQTVCDGVRLNSVVANDKHPRVVVGYKINKREQDTRLGIPLSLRSGSAKLNLGAWLLGWTAFHIGHSLFRYPLWRRLFCLRLHFHDLRHAGNDMRAALIY